MRTKKKNIFSWKRKNVQNRTKADDKRILYKSTLMRYCCNLRPQKDERIISYGIAWPLEIGLILMTEIRFLQPNDINH